MAKQKQNANHSSPSAAPPRSGARPETAAGNVKADEMESDSVRGDTAGPSPQQIAARAYELYLARGGQHGKDRDDWVQAERELRLGRQ